MKPIVMIVVLVALVALVALVGIIAICKIYTANQPEKEEPSAVPILKKDAETILALLEAIEELGRS